MDSDSESAAAAAGSPSRLAAGRVLPGRRCVPITVASWPIDGGRPAE